MLQPPQCFLSLVKSTHDAPHAFKPPEQTAVQMLFSQNWPEGQISAQRPQFSGSMRGSTHAPEQSSSGASQVSSEASRKGRPASGPDCGGSLHAHTSSHKSARRTPDDNTEPQYAR